MAGGGPIVCHRDSRVSPTGASAVRMGSVTNNKLQPHQPLVMHTFSREQHGRVEMP
jgi:hypothetical protein